MDDRLADQHVGEDVGAERAGEELAAMAADRPAGFLRHREVGAADRDPAVGEILPDLIGDIEVGLEPEALRGRGKSRGRGGGQQQAFQHRRFSPVTMVRKSMMRQTMSIAPNRLSTRPVMM